jgi:hypothetical protein
MSETMIRPFVPAVPAHDEVPLVDAIPEKFFVNNVSDSFTLESDQMIVYCNRTYFVNIQSNVLTEWQNNHKESGVEDDGYGVFGREDFKMEYDSAKHTLRIYNNRRVIM